jgi:IS30 family transposase
MKTGYKRLSLDNRVTIEKLLSHGYGDSEIARALNRHRSAVKRELDLWRNQNKEYSAVKAHEYAQKAASFRRKRRIKIGSNPDLKSYIVDKMKE